MQKEENCRTWSGGSTQTLPTPAVMLKGSFRLGTLASRYQRFASYSQACAGQREENANGMFGLGLGLGAGSESGTGLGTGCWSRKLRVVSKFHRRSFSTRICNSHDSLSPIQRFSRTRNTHLICTPFLHTYVVHYDYYYYLQRIILLLQLLLLLYSQFSTTPTSTSVLLRQRL